MHAHFSFLCVQLVKFPGNFLFNCLNLNLLNYKHYFINITVLFLVGLLENIMLNVVENVLYALWLYEVLTRI